MRRSALLVVLLAAAAALAVAATAGQHARVAVTDRSPLTVRGTGFKPFERVVVTVLSSARLTARRTANASGIFIARWQTAMGGKLGCEALVVRAAGNLGTRAVTKIPGIECAQPANPGS